MKTKEIPLIDSEKLLFCTLVILAATLIFTF